MLKYNKKSPDPRAFNKRNLTLNYFLHFNLVKPAKLSKPEPKIIKVEGSGIGVAVPLPSPSGPVDRYLATKFGSVI